VDDRHTQGMDKQGGDHVTHLFLTAILLTLAWILFFNHQLGRHLMSTQAAIDAVVAQLGKAKGEIISKIADLQIQLDDANVADVVDITDLVAAAQALDDIVPDAVEAEPVEDDEDGEPDEDPVVEV